MLMKKAPKKEGHRLFIIATSSEALFMEVSRVFLAFYVGSSKSRKFA